MVEANLRTVMDGLVKVRWLVTHTKQNRIYGYPLPPQSFGHDNTEVRRSVVTAIVQLYMILREKMLPFLAPLTETQLKLVNIYIERAMKEESKWKEQ